MKHIIIDTNVVHWDYFLKGTNIMTLCTTAVRLGHRVYMPKVVVDEIVKQHEIDVTEQCAGFNKQIRNMIRVSGRNDIAEKIDVKDLIDGFEKKLLERLAELNVTLLEYPKTPHEVLVRKELNKTKPFKSSTKGYRDALIWESVLEFTCCLKTPREVIFLSNNSDDFGDKDRKLHPDLITDCQSKGIHDGEILYVSDIHGFISNMMSELQQLDDIVKELNDNHGYGDIDFEEVLSEYLTKDVLSENFEGESLNKHKCVPNIYEYPSVTHISEPSINFETVCRLTNELNVVTCRVDIAVSLDVYVFKSDLAIYGGAGNLKIIGPDWNDHYAYGTDTAYMTLYCNIIVDKDFNNVINMDISMKMVNYRSGFSFIREKIDKMP